MAGGLTKTPDFIFRPARRLIQQLAVGTSILAAGNAYEVVIVAGSARGIVRCKFTQTGTLALNFVGPDTQFVTQQVAGASGAATILTNYTSNQPGSIALVANAENFVAFTHNGEGYLQVLVTNTSGSTGTITYCDVACI
jgi:hypothetical protein